MLIEQMLVGNMAVFCYIVACEKEKQGLIIDPAGDERDILSRVNELGLTIKYVVNTHAHADHTCGNSIILAGTGAPLVMHEADAKEILSPMNQAFSMALGKQPSPKASVIVRDGDILRVGQSELRVIHTPGHSPGSICLYGEGNLFTGDTLFVGSVGRTDLEGGSFNVLISSLRKLLTLPPMTRVWPGHDYGERPVSSLAYEKQNNPYVTDFALGAG